MAETKITSKNQTTIPNDIRKILKIKAGDKVEWHTIKGMVIVNAKKNIKDPINFLTSQITLDFDAVKLVKETREEI